MGTKCFSNVAPAPKRLVTAFVIFPPKEKVLAQYATAQYAKNGFTKTLSAVACAISAAGTFCYLFFLPVRRGASCAPATGGGTAASPRPLLCCPLLHSLVIGGGTHRARHDPTLSLPTSLWRLQDAARHLDAFSVPYAGTLSYFGAPTHPRGHSTPRTRRTGNCTRDGFSVCMALKMQQAAHNRRSPRNLIAQMCGFC